MFLCSAPKKILPAIIDLPSSKSLCNRALILNALSECRGHLGNLSDCDDTQVMLQALASEHEVINIGAAGTAMRFLTAYFALQEGSRVLTGSERMKNRPIRILVDALRQWGAEIEYVEKEGFPPLRINGKKLSGGNLTLDGSISSQYISALLMIAPCLENGASIELTGEIISKPYLEMTLALMSQFGAKTNWNGNVISVERSTYIGIDYNVEPDWSAASYWYEMVSLQNDSKVRLHQIKENSLQGDSRIAEIFKSLGVETTYDEEGAWIHNTGNCVRYLEMDLVNQPDLAQTIVVACALKGIHFRLTGLQSLKIKETDRLLALQQELNKLGFIIHVIEDRILDFCGETCLPESNPVIETYDDHRMAMAFAPAALALKEIRINHPQVVSKSYPLFWAHLATVGFGIEKID